MATNILMPALSPTMEKGNLAKWLKKEGDAIKSGDVIAEIETDKATMEYEAVDEGTLAKIVVPEGTQDVAVNAVIAVMAADGEDVKAAAAGAASAHAAESRPKRRSPQRNASSGTCGNSRRAIAPQQRLPRKPAPAPARTRRAHLLVAFGRVWPRKPASISRASPAPARMAASSRAISKTPNPARA